MTASGTFYPLILTESSGTPIITEANDGTALAFGSLEMSGSLSLSGGVDLGDGDLTTGGDISAVSYGITDSNMKIFEDSGGTVITNAAGILNLRHADDADSSYLEHVPASYLLIRSNTGLIRVNDETQFLSDARVFGDTVLDTVTVGDDALFQSDISAMGALTLDGLAAVDSAEITKSLEVTGTVDATGLVTGEAGFTTPALVTASGFVATPSSGIPLPATNGQLHFDSESQEYYYYDSIRSKWLSMAQMTLTAGKNGLVTDHYLNWADDNVLGAATNGVKLPFDSVMVGWTATGGIPKTFTLSAMDDGTGVTSLDFSSSTYESDMDVNVEFAADSVISFYVDGESRYLGATAFFRRTL